MRVQLVAGEYKVVLPPEAMEELQLKDGDRGQGRARCGDGGVAFSWRR